MRLNWILHSCLIKFLKHNKRHKKSELKMTNVYLNILFSWPVSSSYSSLLYWLMHYCLLSSGRIDMIMMLIFLIRYLQLWLGLFWCGETYLPKGWFSVRWIIYYQRDKFTTRGINFYQWDEVVHFFMRDEFLPEGSFSTRGIFYYQRDIFLPEGYVSTRGIHFYQRDRVGLHNKFLLFMIFGAIWKFIWVVEEDFP